MPISAGTALRLFRPTRCPSITLAENSGNILLHLVSKLLQICLRMLCQLVIFMRVEDFAEVDVLFGLPRHTGVCRERFKDARRRNRIERSSLDDLFQSPMPRECSRSVV
jgi:hypothetical protein